MLDHADPFHKLIDCTRRCCSFLTGLISSLVLPRSRDLVIPSSYGSCNLNSAGNHNLTLMAARETIDIDSSDDSSETWDLDEYRNLDESVFKDSATSSRRVLPSSWGSTNGASSSNYERVRSPPAVSRAVPLPYKPFAPDSKTSNLVEHVGTHNAQGRSNYHAWSNLDISSRKDHYHGNFDDDIMVRENSGNRLLPPSFVQGKNFPGAQYINSNNHIHRPAMGDERAIGSDERLIYQAALQDLNQPKVEATLPEGLLSVSLLRHQKIALAWMLQKETKSCHCSGGILADDQGLGKTISVIALVQMERSSQSKSRSECQSNHIPEALNLDDDDDNGRDEQRKDKETVNLDDDDGDINKDVQEKGKEIEGSNDPKSAPETITSTTFSEFRRQRPAAGTLVICPASVLRQWARELDDKVPEEAKLSVLIYHGGNRTKEPAELARHDVVLTTYAIVTNEVPKQPLVDEDDDDLIDGERRGILPVFFASKKRKKLSKSTKGRKKGKKGLDSSFIDSDCGALARVNWFRVVLDEAQTIKNHRTQVARACCGLRAKRRWCLSGTPIQNSIDELYSYFRFLRYDPYADYKSFCTTLKFAIARNAIHGYKKLQAVLRAIMLRRTKGTVIDGQPIIRLPPKRIHLTKVEFSPEERAYYAKLEADSRSQFKAYAAAGTLHQNYANILLMLLRLRQACDHPLLVKNYNAVTVERESLNVAKRLPRDRLLKLLNLLETSLAICHVCEDPPEDAIVTICGHVFCYQCIADHLTGDDNMCPAHECKKLLGTDVAFSKATLRSCLSEDIEKKPSSSSEDLEKSIVLKGTYVSSKIKAALQIIQQHCKSNSSNPDDLMICNGGSLDYGKEYAGIEGPIKTIVFSQWTGMLDLVEDSLNQSCIQYRRLDGKMSLPARDKAVKEFNSDPEVIVMLMSLKAGNLGLNMVAACRVILLDLWWNPTTEDQAIDRAHRIGQTRPVTVSRLTIKDTVEDRILSLQEEKRKMVASAFGEDHSGGAAARLTVEDLKYLFMGVN